MKGVVIFGNTDTALLADFYITNDSTETVAAFCIESSYFPKNKNNLNFCGKPVVPFEEVEKLYSPKKYKFFAPMVYTDMNRIRARIYYTAKEKGYDFISYISSKATVWQPENIGENCFILEDNTIQPYTIIGNNVVMWSGNHIGHHGTIEDHVFFTSHVVLSGHCHVGQYSFFGVNSSIRDYTVIGESSKIGMGAVVIKDTNGYATYIGNPAKEILGVI